MVEALLGARADPNPPAVPAAVHRRATRLAQAPASLEPHRGGTGCEGRSSGPRNLRRNFSTYSHGRRIEAHSPPPAEESPLDLALRWYPDRTDLADALHGAGARQLPYRAPREARALRVTFDLF